MTMDTMGLACCTCAKVWKDMVRNTPANVKQELMVAPIVSFVPVIPEKAQEAVKTVPQVVKVVVQPLQNLSLPSPSHLRLPQ